ncbi:MAG: glycosyltransferase family 2 protein [Planctomycetota bacterium]
MSAAENPSQPPIEKLVARSNPDLSTSASGVSVIVPTLRERDNLDRLIPRVMAALAAAGLPVEIIVVDDDSRDGTVELIERLKACFPVQLKVRVGRRGLSSAVIEGFALATQPILVVMDADLSHPPEMLGELVTPLVEGRSDFVLGSRYVRGARIEGWTPFRWANSLVATALALPVARVRDPMSGFFAFHRTLIENAALDPVGYKIGLEILARCRPARVLEMPIEFRNRVFGKSKLTWKEQVLYIEHLRRLYQVRWPRLGRFFSFGLVGAAGTLVNLLVLSVLVEFVVGQQRTMVLVAESIAFVVAVTFNYALNRLMTFRDRRSHSWTLGSVKFLLVCLAGFLVNLLTLSQLYPRVISHYAPATVISIVAGYVVNYVGAAVLVFQRPRSSNPE